MQHTKSPNEGTKWGPGKRINRLGNQLGHGGRLEKKVMVELIETLREARALK